MRLNLTTLALAVALPVAAPVVAFAQDPAPAPAAEPLPPPPPPPVVEAAPAAPAAPVAEAAPAAPASGPTIKWEGLVDSYYLWNFNGDPSTQAPVGRTFDTQANSFNLAYAKLGVGVEAGMVGARLDFGYGTVGTVTNGTNAGFGISQPGTVTSLYGSAFLMEQAYATLKLGVLTFDAGKFNTSAGSEVIPANKNWIYSRSLLFNGITVNHTGLRATVAASKEVTIQAAVVNGWNNDPDINGDKTFGLSVILTPVETTLLAANAYVGKEGLNAIPANPVTMTPAVASTNETTVLVDVVANQAIGDAFALNLNFDYYKKGEANWWGLALMGKYTISPAIYLAARGEYLKSKNAYYALDGAQYEGTGTVGLPFGSNYELRLEGRFDGSDKEIFFKGGTAKKNQLTATAAFLAFF
jgi:hypothetical protein